MSAKAKYGGADKYSFYWRADRKMYGLKVGVDNYTGEARYNFKSWIVNLQNMSGTKYWDNYKNARKTAQSVEIGVSKNGYYAVVHAVNADEYTVRLKKNGYSCSSGTMLRYQTTNGYERLRYSSKAF